MDFSTKIRMGEAVAKMSEAELARKIGTTPQAFNQRVKTGKFKYEELESMRIRSRRRTGTEIPLFRRNRGVKEKPEPHGSPGKG